MVSEVFHIQQKKTVPIVIMVERKKEIGSNKLKQVQ
jgi:hypothetical protein